MNKKQKLLTMMMACASVTTHATAPDISDYIIFGENGVFIGASGSEIHGLVGARFNDPVNNAALVINGTSGVQGDVRVGGNVKLGKGHITGSLYRPAGTTLTMSSGGSVGLDLFPIDPELPPLPPATNFTCPTGGANLTGANNQSLTLNPGTYGLLQYGGNFDLTLDGAGDYYFNSITAGQSSKLHVKNAGTRVFVCGAANWAEVEVDTPNKSNCDFYLEAQSNDPENAASFLGNSKWVGDVFTPNGGIHIGSGSSQFGSFIGRFVGAYVDVEHSILGDFYPCEPTPPPKVFPPKDATVHHAKKNENNGATLTLRVGNQVRTLVGFDVSTIEDFSNIKSAKITFTVANNGTDVFPFMPSSQWPGNGGASYLGRLKDGYENWTEGNGNNYPVVNNPRGTDGGVTWNCATDTDISNYKRDCFGDDYWKSGARKLLTSKIGPIMNSNDMPDGVEITVDVTNDVKQGLGPKDLKYMTWVLYTNGQGAATYYSREGAIAAGKPEYAPVLVIEE